MYSLVLGLDLSFVHNEHFSVTHGCGTVVLCNDVLADAQQLISSHLSTGSALASQRMPAAV